MQLHCCCQQRIRWCCVAAGQQLSTQLSRHLEACQGSVLHRTGQDRTATQQWWWRAECRVQSATGERHCKITGCCVGSAECCARAALASVPLQCCDACLCLLQPAGHTVLRCSSAALLPLPLLLLSLLSERNAPHTPGTHQGRLLLLCQLGILLWQGLLQLLQRPIDLQHAPNDNVGQHTMCECVVLLLLLTGSQASRTAASGCPSCCSWTHLVQETACGGHQGSP